MGNIRFSWNVCNELMCHRVSIREVKVLPNVNSVTRRIQPKDIHQSKEWESWPVSENIFRITKRVKRWMIKKISPTFRPFMIRIFIYSWKIHPEKLHFLDSFSAHERLSWDHNWNVLIQNRQYMHSQWFKIILEIYARPFYPKNN